MATLAELTARLAPGDPVEIAWQTNQGVRIEHGRFQFIGRDAFGDEAIFWRRAGVTRDVPPRTGIAAQLAAMTAIGPAVLRSRDPAPAW